MKSKFMIFWSGFVTCQAIYSLYQDYLGKERYLQMVNEEWLSAGITVPLALILLIFAYYLYKEN